MWLSPRRYRTLHLSSISFYLLLSPSISFYLLLSPFIFFYLPLSDCVTGEELLNEAVDVLVATG